MRRNDLRGGKIFKELDQFAARGGVEVAGGFVQQKNFRFQGEVVAIAARRFSP